MPARGVKPGCTRNTLVVFARQLGNDSHMSQPRTPLPPSESSEWIVPERLFALLAHSDDLSLLLDIHMRSVFTGPSLVRVLGYTAAELARLPAKKLVHPDDFAEVSAFFQRLVVNAVGTAWPISYRVRHKDGSWRWLSGRAVNLLEDPAVRAVHASSRR